MNAKHKGSLAELLACAWLLKQGYEVFRNVSQHGVADIIAWRPEGSPILVEVRKTVLRPAVDGTSCSAAVARTIRHPDLRFLYIITETGECSFDLEALAAARGYTLRPPRTPARLVCSVEGCNRKHKARGFCGMHDSRWRPKLVDGASLIPQPKIA